MFPSQITPHNCGVHVIHAFITLLSRIHSDATDGSDSILNIITTTIPAPFDADNYRQQLYFYLQKCKAAHPPTAAAQPPAPPIPTHPPAQTLHPNTRTAKTLSIRQSTIRCLQTPAANLSPDALQFSLNQIYYDHSLRDIRWKTDTASTEARPTTPPQVRVLNNNMQLLANDTSMRHGPTPPPLNALNRYTSKCSPHK